MIKVPFMKMPESCNVCPFGHCVTPFSEDRQVFVCDVDLWEHGKHTIKRDAPIDELVVPVMCPLIDENAENKEDILIPIGATE